MSGLLDRESGQQLASYRGHKNEAYKLQSCLSPDDAHVLGGSEDGGVFVWSLVESKVVSLLRGHTKAVTALSCHPKRWEVLTASHDGTAKLWSCNPGAHAPTAPT